METMKINTQCKLINQLHGSEPFMRS